MKLKYSLLFCLWITLLFTACEQQPPDKKTKTKKPHYVEVVVVTPVRQAIVLTRTGTLRARREVKIYNQEEGKVTLLPFHEGDKVRKGQLIAQLDDALLQAQLNRARFTREKTQQDLKRTQALHKNKLASEESLNTVESLLNIARADEELLGTRLSYTQLAAPFSGVISERLLEPGSVAERFTHLLTVSDPSALITEVHLSALLMARLSINDPIMVSIDALGTEVYPGHILRIHPNINPITRRGIIEVEINPVPNGAHPGQFCRVQIASAEADRLMVPFRTLRKTDEQAYVYVVDDDNKVQRASIVSGLRINEQVEVISGLQPNQKVVSKGFLDLKPGKQVHIVNSQKPALEKFTEIK